MDYFFSIVIPTYNRRNTLFQCLDSIKRQTLPQSMFEVIVIDDGSTDDTQTFCESAKFNFQFTYIKNQNSGPSQARNTGVEFANGKFIAFFEDDILLHPDVLEKAYKYLSTSQIKALEGNTVYQQTLEPIRKYDTVDFLSFIPCNLFIEKKIFLQLGGYNTEFYDKKLKLYFREDTELGFKALKAGILVKKVNDIVVEHPEQFPSLHSSIRHAKRYLFDPLLYKKHKKLFRKLIETKKVLIFLIHRPMHYLSLLAVFSTICSLISLFMSLDYTLLFIVFLLFAGIIFKFKYQGKKALAIRNLIDLPGFMIIPYVYLFYFFKGCIRYKSYGAIL